MHATASPHLHDTTSQDPGADHPMDQYAAHSTELRKDPQNRVTSYSMETAFRRDLRNYPLYFLLWTVLGLFYFSQGLTQSLVSHDPTPWWHYLLAWLSGVYIWALLTPVILFLGRQFPIDRLPLVPAIALHLVLAAGFSVFELSIDSVLYLRLHLFPLVMSEFGGTLVRLLVTGFHGGILQYWMVLGAQWGVLYYQRYQERSRDVLRFELRASALQSQLVRAQLTALKMQLQPHFLFNTLNAITVLVRQQRSRDAEQMLGHLGDLLRRVLEDIDAQEVSLRRELEYLKIYLAIEQVRFSDRLRVEISADPAALDATVPQLILQPIVENAIRHGIGRRSSAGQILISASKINGGVELRVEDDGPGLPPNGSVSNQGIGLANTRARLQQLYGDGASLDIKDGNQGGVVATVNFPFRCSNLES
jgi:two-component system LytT family sensor kinase